MSIQLSSIISGNSSITVSTMGRLNDSEIAQCICNASIGVASTRQLLNHFRLFQADRPQQSYQAWATERGLWLTWTTKAGKVKPVDAGKRKAELVALHTREIVDTVAEWRILCQYEAIRAMVSSEKALDERLHKMEQDGQEAPQERPVEVKEVVPSLPPLVALLTSQRDESKRRLHCLLATIDMDDSLVWIAEELRSIITNME